MPSAGFLLDTSIVVDLIEDNPHIVEALRGLASRPSLSVISQIELEAGVYRDVDNRLARRQSLDVVLAQLEVLVFDQACARAYGEIVAYAGYSRRKVIDRMIAAQALVHDLTLITANPHDFADIAGLGLLAW